MTAKLKKQQIQEYREAFDMFDLDGGGTISNTELLSVFKSLGQNPTQEEIEEMLPEGQEMDFQQFLHLMSSKIQTNLSPVEITEAFKVLDADDDGLIDVHDLRGLLMNQYEKEALSLEEVEALLIKMQTVAGCQVEFIDDVPYPVSRGSAGGEADASLRGNGADDSEGDDGAGGMGFVGIGGHDAEDLDGNNDELRNQMAANNIFVDFKRLVKYMMRVSGAQT